LDNDGLIKLKFATGTASHVLSQLLDVSEKVDIREGDFNVRFFGDAGSLAAVLNRDFY
jgi:hypothetical protein